MMEKISWEKEYDMNIEEIDKYYREIVEYLNITVDRIAKGKERKSITTALMNVLERMRACFKAEEKYMHLFKYPDQEEHAKKHKRIVKRVVYIRKLFSDEERKIDDENLEYFKNWLQKHMTDDNKKFAPYMRLHKRLMEG